MQQRVSVKMRNLMLTCRVDDATTKVCSCRKVHVSPFAHTMHVSERPLDCFARVCHRKAGGFGGEASFLSACCSSLVFCALFVRRKQMTPPPISPPLLLLAFL